MADPENGRLAAPLRRSVGILLLVLAFGLGGGPQAASAFEAPDGCRNATLLDFPSAGFPRVLPLSRFCPFEPRTDCLGEATPSRSRLLVWDKADKPKRDRFVWKLRKGQAMTATDVGDPTLGTDYELCVYVEVANVCWLILHPDVLAGDGWKRHRRGYSFRAKAGVHPEGIRRLRLKTGANGKSRLVLKGKGTALDLRALPVPPDAEILVQLYNGADRCWSTEFGVEPVIDTEKRYKDRSDAP
jgi:hypothetical protein